jgi:hypothetical protein
MVSMNWARVAGSIIDAALGTAAPFRISRLKVFVELSQLGFSRLMLDQLDVWILTGAPAGANGSVIEPDGRMLVHRNFTIVSIDPVCNRLFTKSAVHFLPAMLVNSP